VGPQGSGSTLNIVYSAGETLLKAPVDSEFVNQHDTFVPARRGLNRSIRMLGTCLALRFNPEGGSLPASSHSMMVCLGQLEPVYRRLREPTAVKTVNIQRSSKGGLDKTVGYQSYLTIEFLLQRERVAYW
jgi:hypothetical protein